MWYIYILRCADGSFYTGITTDLENRLKHHNSGKGSKYTRTRRPVELAHSEKAENKSKALIREIQIKKLSAKNKARLIKFGMA